MHLFHPQAVDRLLLKTKFKYYSSVENEGTAQFVQIDERQGGFELSGSFAKALKLHINFQFQMTPNTTFLVI